MTDPRCGSPRGYQAHRYHKTPPCQPCKTAQADWQRHYRTRVYLAKQRLTIDATGTHRRLQALARIGWSLGELSGRIGLTRSTLVKVLAHERIHLTTAQKVAKLYDELWNQPGGSNHAVSRAIAKGWVSPLAWDDDEIDNPAAKPAHNLRGTPGRQRDEDRDERVIELTRAGLSAKEIALRLRVTPRTVNRTRTRFREEGAA